MMLEKQVARKKARELLREWGKHNRPRADQKVAEHLGKLLIQVNAFSKDGNRLVGVYAPLASEPDWKTNPALESGLALAFPQITGSEMVFRQCNSSELVNSGGGLGILEAPTSAKIVVPQVIIVPGQAFSWKGMRLGRGKGYYDRYFKAYSGLKIALSFSVLIWDELPAQTHDLPVDWLVCEKGVFNCKESIWAFCEE